MSGGAGHAPGGNHPQAAGRTDTNQPALEFEGTNALIRLPDPGGVSAVLFDDLPMPPHRWRVLEDGTLRVACPPIGFDTNIHRLRLQWTTDGAGDVELPFRSDYRCALDQVDDRTIRGWIYDALRPNSSLTLDVAGETWADFAVLNTLDHRALADRDPPVRGGGFELSLPPRANRSRPELLGITVRGTLHQPFGPLLRGTALPAAVATAAAAMRSFGRTPSGLLAGGILLPALVRALNHEAAQARRPEETPAGDAGPEAPENFSAGIRRHGATRLRGTLGLSRPAPPSVDVIVPAYRGAAETLACVHSVLASGNRIGHRVVAIDDCSPEPDLTAGLQALATEGRIVYLRNDTNLGFVATANRGMALGGASGSDVLLLNSDTVVPPGFLDRLYRAAYADAAIATVTPLSNNATICSLPLPPGMDSAPYGLKLNDLDAICREANAGMVRDIPTAHGFCMYVKRAALDEVGGFDVDEFGAGYGEENDFSLRAFERGWRNVCAADVFVEHKGAVSFAGTSQDKIASNLRKVETRYPYYHDLVADFLRTDPLHDLRNRIQKAVWRRTGRIVLFVTLSLEGGAVRHVDDMMRRLTEEGCLAIALGMGRDGDDRPMPVVRRWNSGEALHYPQPARIAETLADILDLAPQFIHVQHLLDLPDGVAEFVRDCGIPYAVTLHDFFYACPKVTLIDEGGSYCGMPPAAKCTACVRHGPVHANMHPTLVDHARAGEVWRGKWEGLLHDAMQVVAPSQDTATRYASLFPALTVEVRPHFGTLHPMAPRPAPRPAPRLRVAVPGAIGPQKGARQLLDLARHCARWDDDIVFVVVGRTDRDKELERYENVRLPGSYAPGQAVPALLQARCRVALFLSIFPETYSYTLSESLDAGLVPVAYDFGALGERLRALGVGVLVPLEAPPAQVAAAIREAADMAAADHLARLPREAIYGQYRRLLADYYAPALTDLAESIPPPDIPRLLTWPAGVHRDRWCDSEARLQVWSPRPIVRLMLSFWVPKQIAFQAVEIVWQGIALAREFLEDTRAKRIVVTIPARDVRYLDVVCRFDFVTPLQPPDQRACAAMFSAIEISDGSGWQAVETPELPGRSTHR